MKFDLKLKALSRLAEAENAEAALRRELASIAKSLKADTLYETLENQIQMLNAFGYRVHGPAIEVLVSFIQRLDEIEITYSDQEGYPEDYFIEFQNAGTLIIAAIDAMIRLRYLETETVLDVLMGLSLHEDESIQNKAIAGLDALGSYEISVFYGPDQKGGIGAAPQLEIIRKLESLDDSEIRKYFVSIMTLTQSLLSPTMETTSSTYNTVTWMNTVVPALPEVIDIRCRSVSLLKRMYGFTDLVSEKLSLISSLNAATRTHHGGEFSDDILLMIAKDTIEIHKFFEDLIATEDMPVIQKIEHDTYWRFYHSLTKDVEVSARAIESAISAHAEYQIYKSLIGFDGIFGDWDELKKTESQWEKVDEFRNQKAAEYAESITKKNYEEWRQRIFKYTETESDDLATFPVFFQFLENFAKESPELAFKLVSNDSERIQSFIIPLLRTLWGTEEKARVLELINDWIEEGRYLFQCTKMFLGNDALDTELLSRLFEKAKDVGDLRSATLVVSVSASNYSEENNSLLDDFFLPAIEFLTANSDTSWMHDFWYRRESKTVIEALNDAGIDLVLENLSYLDEIDYHVDQTLSLIAQREPLRVLTFFGQRLMLAAKDEDKRSSAFDAIPYELHKLKEPLSKIPEEAVSVVREWYDGNLGMFIYRGARLLKNIFPDFPEAFEKELLKLINAGGEENYEFVLAVLRNYEGEPFIHGVCKEIIKAVPEGNSLLTNVAMALESTGVVTGEFGFSEAHERKANEVKGWLTDPSEKVQIFAKDYIEGLMKRSAMERRRSEEEIELRKHQYGE